jgi:CII-binding regulator of phage lambda lysogenization HflD
MENKIENEMENEMENKIEQISNQTNYSRKEILKKLKEHNEDVISVIREYMGIKPSVENTKINTKQINQEIYRQIRKTMDDGMRTYREKNPINIEEVTNNLRQSEERKNKNK